MFYTEFHPDQPRNVENKLEIHFYLQVNYGCHWSNFHEIRVFSKAFL